MSQVIVWRACAFATFLSSASAQGPVFQTPGMPSVPSNYAAPGSSADSGQASRFSSVFNPAFSFVIDAVLDSIQNSGTSPDGEQIDLRSMELGAQSWIDPNAWAYFIAVSDGEALNIEEAAVHFTGLGGHSTIRAGRFFIDFGKQMQTHVHELRTLERPLALRAFLGDEVKGDGLQWDSWTSVGDKTAVRWSIGVFKNLLPESVEDIDASPEAAQSVEERKGIEDFNATARLTAFTDVSDNGVLQIGTSARFLPSFAYTFEPSGDEARGLDNTVFGLDLTYGLTNDTGLQSWTFGGEYLIDTGDTFAEIGDSGTPGDSTDDVVDVVSQNLNGYFAFVDYGWNKFDSVGFQFSQIESPESGTPDVSESEVYYSHQFSEFQRLRFGVIASDFEDGEDSMRFAIQYTVFVGAHGHGINW